MDFYVVNCQPKALKCNSPTSFNIQVTCVLVAQKLRGLEACGYIWLYIETIYWLSIITACILWTIVEHPITVTMAVRCASTERQRSIFLPIQQSRGCIVLLIQKGSIGSLDRWKCIRHARCPILEMSLNGVWTIFGLASWLITRLCSGINT